MGKDHDEAVYCHPACLTYMQEFIMWNSRLKSRLPYQQHRYADDITLMAESEEELKNLLKRGKEENEKSGLKQH